MKVLFSLILALALAFAGATAEAAPRKNRNTLAPAADDQGTSRSSSSSTMPLGGKLEFDPAFGFAMIGPSDVNGLIRDQNNSIQKQGVKSFNADEIGTTSYWGFDATYRVLPSVGLGIGFNRLSANSETSAKVGDNNLDANFEISANFLTAESRLTIFGSRREKLEAVLSPFMGIGFYKASSTFSGSALDKTVEVNSSAKGFVVGSNATMRYWFLPNLAGGLTAGYRFAKSGNLKVDSQQGSDTAVGSQVESNGKKIQVDAGSFLIGAALTWAI